MPFGSAWRAPGRINNKKILVAIHLDSISNCDGFFESASFIPGIAGGKVLMPRRGDLVVPGMRCISTWP
jgi:hypothetical protein